MNKKFSQLVKRIHDTQPVEIDCSACLEHISEYVDHELGSGSAAEHLPKVKQHLEQCGVCFDEYQLLHSLAAMEKDGDEPSAESLIEQLKKTPQ